MPSTVNEADSYYASDWTKWPVPTMPDLTVVPWNGSDAFWTKDITDRPVDAVRTAALASVNIPIRASAGAPPYAGSTYGTPYQMVDSTTTKKTNVWDLGRPVTWNWFTPTWPTVALPLPDVVRRMGDPGNSSDRNWIGYDEKRGKLYETISMIHSQMQRFKTLGQSDWTIGYDGAVGAHIWNTNRPWSDPSQPKGATAASWPLLPMLCRWQEISEGVIRHAVNGALPNYSPTFIPPARGSDGTDASYPIRCGDLLRLKQSKVESFPTGSPARIIAQALHVHGWFCSDKNWAFKSDGKPDFGAFPLSMDKRWTTGEGNIPALGTFEVQLTDFEVVTA